MSQSKELARPLLKRRRNNCDGMRRKEKKMMIKAMICIGGHFPA